MSTIGEGASDIAQPIKPIPLPSRPKDSTSGARAQTLATVEIPALPHPQSRMPVTGSPEFERKVRKMGLDPAEVKKLAALMKEDDIDSFRR